MNLLTKQKRTHRLTEQTYGYRGEGCVGGIVGEFGIDINTLLYLGWMANRDLLCSTGNSAQYYVAT